MNRPSASRMPSAWLVGLLAACVMLSGCSTVNPKSFGEGVRVMTGRGGTVEERDTIKEIVPDARDLATYQPKPDWQTVLRADATDLMEFVSLDRVLVGTVQFGSALAEPNFGGVELYDSLTGRRLWEGKRKDIGNGACEILYLTDMSVVRPGNHLEADAATYAWYASLGVFVALGVVWLVRPPVV